MCRKVLFQLHYIAIGTHRSNLESADSDGGRRREGHTETNALRKKGLRGRLKIKTLQHVCLGRRLMLLSVFSNGITRDQRVPLAETASEIIIFKKFHQCLQQVHRQSAQLLFVQIIFTTIVCN